MVQSIYRNGDCIVDKINNGENMTIELVNDEEIKRNRTKTKIINRRKTYTYTDKELLDYLIKFYKENRRNPTVADFDHSSNYPNHMTYIRRFGGWNNALKMTGLQPNNLRITDKELLDYLIQFYKENGRSPVWYDFKNNPKYQDPEIYQYHFGSWQKALKIVGLDVESMIKKGIIHTEQQKARLWELKIIEYLGDGAIDLSGENFHSSYDGIYHKYQTYDAKSSKLYDEGYFSFSLNSVYRENIERFYLGGFNKDYTELLYAWLIPGDFVDGNLKIGLNNNWTYNIENMKEFEITDKFKMKPQENN